MVLHLTIGVVLVKQRESGSLATQFSTKNSFKSLHHKPTGLFEKGWELGMRRLYYRQQDEPNGA